MHARDGAFLANQVLDPALDVGTRELLVLEHAQEVRLQLSLSGTRRRFGQTLEQDVSLFLRERRQPERMSAFSADKAMDRPDLQARRGCLVSRWPFAGRKGAQRVRTSF